MSNEELELTFWEELRALESTGRKLPIEFSPTRAWMLLKVLAQTLVGHEPRTSGELYCLDLARNLESRLCKTPAMQETARRLWAAPSPEPEPEPAPKLNARVAARKKAKR